MSRTLKILGIILTVLALSVGVLWCSVANEPPEYELEYPRLP